MRNASSVTASGAAAFTVAGVFRDYASEHGRIFMGEAAYRQLWPEQPAQTLALFAGIVGSSLVSGVLAEGSDRGTGTRLKQSHNLRMAWIASDKRRTTTLPEGLVYAD